MKYFISYGVYLVVFVVGAAAVFILSVPIAFFVSVWMFLSVVYLCTVGYVKGVRQKWMSLKSSLDSSERALSSLGGGRSKLN